MKRIAHIDKKYFDYQYIESRSIFTSTPQTGGTLQPNQRCYFGPGQKLKGNRVVGIDVFSIGSVVSPVIYNNVPIVSPFGLSDFVLTLVDKDGREAIKNYPVNDLFYLNNTFGNTRVFDIIPDMEACYVTSCNGGWPLFQLILNLYTVDW